MRWTVQILLGVALSGCVFGQASSNRSTFVNLEHTPSSIVYDPVRRVAYAAQPAVSRVDVIAVPAGTVVDQILIPFASAVAISPSANTLAVGTQGDFIYLVDTATRRVTQRLTMPRDSFGSVNVNRLAITKTGKVLFGGSALRQWDPATGHVKVFPNVYLTLPEDYNADVTVASSGDGAKVLIAGSFSSTYLYDAETESLQRVGPSIGGPTYSNVAANHDGSQFAVYEADQVRFLNASLAELGRLTVSTSGFVYSRDGRFLYLAAFNGFGRVVITIDTTSFQIVSQAPGVVLMDSFYHPTADYFYQTALFGSVTMAAADEGLILGMGSLGVTIEDVTHTPGLDSAAPYIARLFPAQGGVGGGTALQVRGTFTEAPTAITFGLTAATTPASYVSAGRVAAISPPSPSYGPVNVKASFTSGWFALSPHGFTYGPHILYLLTSGGPSEGGTRVKIIGYGFGYPAEQISVRFGGQSGNVISVSTDAPNTLRPNGFSIQFGQYPYHLIEVITPPGLPGEADVTVSTPSGSTTWARSFTYLKTAQVVPYGSELASPVYDWLRQRVYFSDPALGKVAVFDIATRQFLPGLLDASAGAGRSALSPDASRLVVANQAGRSISVIKLTEPQASTLVNVIENGEYSTYRVYGLTTTADGFAFVSPYDSGYGGCRFPLLRVDLTTLQVTKDPMLPCMYDTPYFSSRRDGSQIFIAGGNNTGGPIRTWKASTDSFAVRYFTGFTQISAAADGNAVVGDLQVINADLTYRSKLYKPSAFFTIDPFTYGRGMSLNASGSLAYVPREHGYLDLHNARTGQLLRRIKLPAEFYSAPALLYHYDGDFPTMTVDDSGHFIFGATEAGAMMIEIAELPLALGAITPAAGEPAGGTVARIRGSGFVPGTIASLGGQDVTTTYIDESTLEITTPPHSPGRVTVAVRNPNGERAEMHAEFRYVVPATLPSITSVAPNEITIQGGQFTITGQNFLPESVVLWNGRPIPTEYLPSGQLSAYLTLVPIPLGTSQITVETPPPGGGRSAPAPVEVYNPAPYVTIEYPTEVTAGGPTFGFRFRAHGFLPTTKLYWNDTEIPYTSNAGHNATVDASLIATPGTAIIRAVNPPPVLGTAPAATILIKAPTPAAGLNPVTFVSFANTLIFGSKTQAVGLYSFGTAPFELSSVTTTGPFEVSSTTCGSTIPGGQNCIVNVTFRPKTLGQHTGTLNVTGNVQVAPFPLQGTSIDFTFALQRPSRPARNPVQSAASREAFLRLTLTSTATESVPVTVRCISRSPRHECAATSRDVQLGQGRTAELLIRWTSTARRAGRLSQGQRTSAGAVFAIVLAGPFGEKTIEFDVAAKDLAPQ